MTLLSLPFGTLAIASADVIVPVISSMESCRRLGGTEPAAVLEFRKAPIAPPETNPDPRERRRIYSDLCTISEQPLARIVIDAEGDVAGIGLANSFGTGSPLTLSSHWRS